ncbi:MAG: hypothetical protein Q4G58_09975 [bacterium]|nr:hypothetical protein [bacterium]
MKLIMNNIRQIRNYYLVFAILYLVVCFVPLFSMGVQTFLQKLFWLVLIGYTIVEFADNLKDMNDQP